MKSVEAERWWVQVALQGCPPQTHRLAAAALDIGRDPTCHVVLPSPDVSRRHLHVWRDGDEVHVRDLSTNGALCDGRAMGSQRALSPDTELGVGPYTVRIRHAGTGDGCSERGGRLSHADVAAQDFAERDSCAAVVNDDAGAQLLRRKARDLLLERLDLGSLAVEELASERMRPRVEQALQRIWRELCEASLPESARAEWMREMLDEALGLGPLEPLLADPDVSEIMVVDRATIYVERAGRVSLCEARFTDDISLRTAIERIVTPLGRRIDVASPMVDARLSDGSRVNAVIEPLALRGPCLTIRRFPKTRLTMDDLLARGALSADMARFLQRTVASRRNLVIAGGTGTGKTTLLNVLSAFIGPEERVVTIEDAAELSLAQPHVVPLEARPANAEGAGAVTIRDLVRNALRMRPDRIVVGECRGGEAIDMLQAMNTGHDGSMTTTHANTPPQALQRLETLCLLGDVAVPATVVRRQIAASVEVLVQLSRGADGCRRITEISEVVGFDDHTGAIEVHDIFQFRMHGTDPDGHIRGSYRPTGYLPSFVQVFVQRGLATEEDAL